MVVRASRAKSRTEIAALFRQSEKKERRRIHKHQVAFFRTLAGRQYNPTGKLDVQYTVENTTKGA